MSSRSQAPSIRALRRQVLGGAALACALILTAAPAAAGGTKVALNLEGPAAVAEKTLRQVLAHEGYEVVGSAAYRKASRRARGKGEAVIAETARRLGVSAVVSGSVDKTGQKPVLILSVHNGKDGALIALLEIGLTGNKPDADTIVSGLPALVKRGQAPVGGGDENGVPGGVAPQVDEAELPQPRETPLGVASKAAPPVEHARRTAVEASVGMSLWTRRMSVSPSGSASAYAGRPTPGLRLDGELYPVALFANSSWAADLGIGLFVDMFWASSQLAGSSQHFSTTQQRWGVDVHWRYALTKSETSPVVRVAFSIEDLAFGIANRATASTNLNIPDVEYLSFGPTVGLLLPLGTPRLRLGAHLSYLATSGTESNPGTGGQHRGLSSTWGIDFGVHVDYLPRPWLRARAQFGLTSYSSSYKPGAGQTITGMSDLYLGGLLTIGYIY
jgi:hypothetical protein